MKNKIQFTILLFLSLSFCGQAQESKAMKFSDPLPSWNSGASKTAIINFVTKTTKEGSADFIPQADRIAVFDNDGTLWTEQPMYFQVAFAMDQIKAMAPQHPEWKTTQPFKAALENDMETLVADGVGGLLDIFAVTHTGMTTDVFEQTVKDWMATATHPITKKHYNEMTYQPMVELLQYLRANGYKTYIASGGGIVFMRSFAEQAYGIPPEQVIGSTGKLKYEVVDGKPVLMKISEFTFNNDDDGKPIGIYQHTGKRPVFAAGNSDGDYQMLQWTTTATGYPRFGMYVHHTDAEREYAYDRGSHIGELNKGLDDAAKNNWLIVDMKNDWAKIYPGDE